jgi:hypothetical protein
MITPDGKNAVAGKQIEIAIVFVVVEILSLAPAIDFIESDRTQDADELRVDMALVQRIILAPTLLKNRIDIERHSVRTNNLFFKCKLSFVLWATVLGIAVGENSSQASVPETSLDIAQKCPGYDAPPPAILEVDTAAITKALENLKDTQGRPVWKNSPEAQAELTDIFRSTPRKTKLEQFFQLLFLIQKQAAVGQLPMTVSPPGITDVLLAARVFTDPAFPKKITLVELKNDDPSKPPLYRVQFADAEVRFPINQGKGFSTWDQGLCQIAKELIFQPGFSFRIRNARNSKNLVVDHFDKVEIFGQFGTRKIVSIDLQYVDLEKVEFISGTDQGKVKARVAQREFKENQHSAIFKFIGTMIPNTSTQRIDW